MATTRTVQRPTAAGATLTFANVDATGDNFINSGREFIQIKNGSGSGTDVTVTSPSTSTCSFGKNTGHDLVVTVAAGATSMIGPFDTTRFNSDAGLCTATCNPTASIQIAVTAL